jgi:glutathione S-transferase
MTYGENMKSAAYLAINPMGKVPAIAHNGRVVTEVAAICCYLADAFPEAGLAPDLKDRADYYRWLFFAAGPVEAAFSNRAVGWEPDTDRQRMFGYGNYDLAMGTLAKALSANDYLAADRFTAADLFVGSMVSFMLQFKLLEAKPVFTDYVARVTGRDAFRRASELDNKLTAEVQPASS